MKVFFIVLGVIISILFYIRWVCEMYDGLIYWRDTKKRHKWSDKKIKIFAYIWAVVVLLQTPFIGLANLWGEGLDGRIICREWAEFLTQRWW